VVGNDHSLITLGHSGEIMAWFYPARDHAQHITQCLPCIYIGPPQQGSLHWTWWDEWERHQEYLAHTNLCVTTLRSNALGLQIEFTDVVPPAEAALVRRITVRNLANHPASVGVFHYGDWNMDGLRMGNGLHFDHASGTLVQSHRETTAVIGGDALEIWQCGKAGRNWHNNALYDLDDGALRCQDLEIGDVNWAFGFHIHLQPEEVLNRTVVFALGPNKDAAMQTWHAVRARKVDQWIVARREADAVWLTPGLAALERALSRPISPQEPEAATVTRSGSTLGPELVAAYTRSLLCLPLLCGTEGVAVAAPEFDPEFESCGGYGYFWPRDGAEYVSGLLDAGYPEYASRLFDWCARHQDPVGLWHQRYFLNGAPGPNWCLPPEMLQIDQVGAVLWAYGKWMDLGYPGRSCPVDRGPASAVGTETDAAKGDSASGDSDAIGTPEHLAMIRKAADYLRSRLTPRGVHANAFDTWETFIGSFTYSNAALYAGFRTAARALGAPEYDEAAAQVKQGVLAHFRINGGLARGFNQWGEPDRVIDSSALGAIEPFGLLDLTDTAELAIAEGTLRMIQERLEVDFEGGRAIRRFEGDAYVGGVPACVNTLWTARCCCTVAGRLHQLGRTQEAAALTARARLYLTTVLRRTTPTGLLPELMQGPAGQRYWAAPHGWAMASFVSAVLMLSHRLSKEEG
jgi:GH15 family glucan-1,4-alpha-glucosidase